MQFVTCMSHKNHFYATATDVGGATSNAPIGSGGTAPNITTAAPYASPTNVQDTATAPPANAPADSAIIPAAQPTVTNTAKPVIEDEGKTTD